MSTSSVTICSTRNVKSFEKFKKVTFWEFFSKNDQKGPKTQIRPHAPKSISCILQERFGGTEVLRNIVIRSKIPVLYFMSLCFHVIGLSHYNA